MACITAGAGFFLSDWLTVGRSKIVASRNEEPVTSRNKEPYPARFILVVTTPANLVDASIILIPSLIYSLGVPDKPIGKNTMKRNWLPYVELSIAMVIVGSNIVAGKMIIASFPIFLFSTLRFAIGSAILLILMFRSGGSFAPVGRRDASLLFIQALTGSFLYSILLLYGLQLTSAATSGIISGTVPAVIGIISYLFLRERLTWNRSAGITLVVVGMIVINSVGVTTDAQRGANPLLGNFLIVGSVIGEAMWTVLSKSASSKIAPITSATIISCFAFILFLPFGIYQALNFDFTSVSLLDWSIVVYYGSVGTVVAYLLWYHGVAKVSASTAGVFTGIFPISALLLAYIILGEPLTWSHAIGAFCVLLAIILIARETPDHPPIAPKEQ